jgi:hypothetical protein
MTSISHYSLSRGPDAEIPIDDALGKMIQAVTPLNLRMLSSDIF